jgi:endonuclease/exonuclease/phosphatase family metal-dependent hydrolase
MRRGATLKLLSWNIRANCGAHPARVGRIAEAIAGVDADVVMLQEVANDAVANQLREELRARGLSGWHFSGRSGGRFRYGNAIASRFDLRPASRPRIAPPWPQLFARVTIDTAVRSIEIANVHMPNGSTYAWKKIEMFEALGSLLARDHKTARIVGGDFNEPRRFTPSGAVESFGADLDGVVRGFWKGHPNARWQNAVDNVLGPRSPLLHTWFARNPGRAQTTHLNRGSTSCFFDHVLVSRDHFEVVASGYHHRWRHGTKAMSDHSGAWVTLRYG